MAAFRRAFLFCDACGSSLDASAVPGARTVVEARKEGVRAGWHRAKDGQDICPDCWIERREHPGKAAAA